MYDIGSCISSTTHFASWKNKTNITVPMKSMHNSSSPVSNIYEFSDILNDTNNGFSVICAIARYAAAQLPLSIRNK